MVISISKYTLISLTVLVLMMSLISCQEHLTIRPFYEEDDETIADYILTSLDTFSYFRELMIAGHLETTLAARNPHGDGYSLFLPTNSAFDRFIDESPVYGSFQDFLNDLNSVNILARFHIVNTEMSTFDFPFGALPDTTMSGDLLTIGFSGAVDSTVLMVNNEAVIVRPNIKMINGYIHVIDNVLKPVVNNSYEWLSQNSEFSLFTQALEVTGLKDTFNIPQGKGASEYPVMTLFVEPDLVFHRKGIFSVDDLKEKYSSGEGDYTSNTNGLYQFVAYHILEGSLFLNNFEGVNTNFNTYASLPISVNATGIDIMINKGVEIFDTLVSNSDTTLIDFVGIEYDRSNKITENGPLHIIEQVLELYRPGSKQRIFQFYEEPMILEAYRIQNTYYFKDASEFSSISWEGVDEMIYVNSPSDIAGVVNNDYVQVDGEFALSYVIPKVLPGRYMLKINAHSSYSQNAFIRVTLDGKRIGGSIDLTTNSGNGSWYTYDVGQVNFTNYEKHRLLIETLIPGRMSLDAVYFTPVTGR